MEKNEMNWADVFNNPFESGLIKEDAIDKILADPKLLEIINKIK
jgi:hypothetical protein